MVDKKHDDPKPEAKKPKAEKVEEVPASTMAAKEARRAG